LTGYTLVNVDVNQSNTNLWFGTGILFTAKDPKNFAVSYVNFSNEELSILQNNISYRSL
jgi:hypothetical protein